MVCTLTPSLQSWWCGEISQPVSFGFRFCCNKPAQPAQPAPAQIDLMEFYIVSVMVSSSKGYMRQGGW